MKEFKCTVKHCLHCPAVVVTDIGSFCEAVNVKGTMNRRKIAKKYINSGFAGSDYIFPKWCPFPDIKEEER